MSHHSNDSEIPFKNAKPKEPEPQLAPISHSQLHKLVSQSQELTKMVRQVNRQGVLLVEEEKYEQGLRHLLEAERILEYAANCGKNLDIILITTTLRNIACTYQRLWQLSLCSDYIQALLMNLSSESGDQELIFIQKLSSDQLKQLNEPELAQIQKILNKKLLIALTNLQYSAVCSQMGKHLIASRAAQKAISDFHTITQQLLSYQRITAGKNSQLLLDLHKSLSFSTSGKKIDRLLKQAKASVSRVKKHRHFFSFDTGPIVDTKIGDIMQIEPVTLEDVCSQLEPSWFISQQGLIYLSLYASCAYFALATQTRLLSARPSVRPSAPVAQTLKQPTRPLNQQMIESQMIHLHSINMATRLILIETMYGAHVMRSFKNNYHIDLQAAEVFIEEDQLLQTNSEINLTKQLKGQRFSREDIETNLENGEKRDSIGRKRGINVQMGNCGVSLDEIFCKTQQNSKKYAEEEVDKETKQFTAGGESQHKIYLINEASTTEFTYILRKKTDKSENKKKSQHKRDRSKSQNEYGIKKQKRLSKKLSQIRSTKSLKKSDKKTISRVIKNPEKSPSQRIKTIKAEYFNEDCGKTKKIPTYLNSAKNKSKQRKSKPNKSRSREGSSKLKQRGHELSSRKSNINIRH